MSQNYIQSLPQAFEVIKQMNLTPGWNSDYRFAARNVLVRILEDRMEDRLDRYPEESGRALSDILFSNSRGERYTGFCTTIDYGLKKSATDNLKKCEKKCFKIQYMV